MCKGLCLLAGCVATVHVDGAFLGPAERATVDRLERDGNASLRGNAVKIGEQMIRRGINRRHVHVGQILAVSLRYVEHMNRPKEHALFGFGLALVVCLFPLPGTRSEYADSTLAFADLSA